MSAAQAFQYVVCTTGIGIGAFCLIVAIGWLLDDAGFGDG